VAVQINMFWVHDGTVTVCRSQRNQVMADCSSRAPATANDRSPYSWALRLACCTEYTRYIWLYCGDDNDEREFLVAAHIAVMAVPCTCLTTALPFSIHNLVYDQWCQQFGEISRITRAWIAEFLMVTTIRGWIMPSLTHLSYLDLDSPTVAETPRRAMHKHRAVNSVYPYVTDFLYTGYVSL